MSSCSSSPTKKTNTTTQETTTKTSTDTKTATWYCAIVLLGLILVASITSSEETEHVMKGNMFLNKPCEEIYVVGEGETLNTISDKCGDPFIVERNPHIHDPDDVFPGLVIKITPARTSSR